MSWNSRFGGRSWRVTPRGVVSRNADDSELLHRTRGEPVSMRLYLALWRKELLAAAQEARVPVALLLACVATENGPAVVEKGRLMFAPVRNEPGYKSDEETPHRVSVGPCHPLISSARAVMNRRVDRDWLLVPANNLLVCAKFIANQRAMTEFDPILVAAAYNAGSVKSARPGENFHNEWHLRAYGDHLTRFANWYGDAVEVLEECRLIAQLDAGGLGRVR